MVANSRLKCFRAVSRWAQFNFSMLFLKLMSPLAKDLHYSIKIKFTNSGEIGALASFSRYSRSFCFRFSFSQREFISTMRALIRPCNINEDIISMVLI